MADQKTVKTTPKVYLKEYLGTLNLSRAMNTFYLKHLRNSLDETKTMDEWKEIISKFK